MSPQQPIKDALVRPGGIADRLRTLRDRAGLPAKELAEQAGWHPSKVSRIENGRQAPSRGDIEAWGRLTDAGAEEVREVLTLLDEIEAEHRSWRLSMRQGQAAVQGDYNQLVQESTLIRHFEVTVVPGLLQTPAYARAMFAEMAELVGPDAGDLNAAVAVRLQRQALLYQPGRQFEFLLAESVLRWLLIPADVMRGQLDRLHTVIGLPNVRFGVLPFGVQLHTIPQHSVTIYQGAETVVAVELFAAEWFHRGEDAEVFNRAVDRLWVDAATGEDARRLITVAAAALPTRA